MTERYSWFAWRVGREVHGVVLDAAGHAVERVSVVATSQGSPQVRRNVSTDADGAFRIRGMPPGQVQLRARTRSRPVAHVRASAVAGDTDVVLRLPLEPAKRELSLVILDSNGAPVPRARAEVLSARESPREVSVRDGRATFLLTREQEEDMARGRWRVRVRDARTVDRERLPLGPALSEPLVAKQRTVRVVLGPERDIRGCVLSPDGEPIPDAIVSTQAARPGRPGAFFRSGGDSVETDVEGRFRLRYLGPGPHRVTVDAGPRFLPLSLDTDAGGRDVTLQLRAAGSARVRVLGPDASPIAGARLWAVPVALRSRSRQTPRRRANRGGGAITGAGGEALLSRLDPDARYDLVVSSGREDVQAHVVEDWMPARTTVLRLQEAMVIRGRLVTPDGRPVPGRRVELLDYPGGFGRRSDESGYFRMTGLVPGTYTLRVRALGTSSPDARPIERSISKSARDLRIVVPLH